MAGDAGRDDGTGLVGIGEIREKAERRAEGSREGRAKRDHGVRDRVCRSPERNRAPAEEPPERLFGSHRVLERDPVQRPPVPRVHVLPLATRKELDRFGEAGEENPFPRLDFGCGAIVPVGGSGILQDGVESAGVAQLEEVEKRGPAATAESPAS